MGLKDEARCSWEVISIIRDATNLERMLGTSEPTALQRVWTDLALLFHLKHAGENVVAGGLALCRRTLRLLRRSHIVGSVNE